jgi:hypothetical protein
VGVGSNGILERYPEWSEGAWFMILKSAIYTIVEALSLNPTMLYIYTATHLSRLECSRS